MHSRALGPSDERPMLQAEEGVPEQPRAFDLVKKPHMQPQYEGAAPKPSEEDTRDKTAAQAGG